MQPLISLIAGLIFGAGLAVGGMINPARVQAFLDLFGHWDPTLAFVMGGAILPMTMAWVIKARLDRPLAGGVFDLPDTRKLDRHLAIGALLFGAGWGIGGLCPGPAIADLALVPGPALLFVAAMLAGMGVHRLTLGR